MKAALVEGIVPGGGVTHVNLATKYAIKSEDAAIAAGEKLLVEALQKPFAILLKNSGLNADEWLPQVKSAKTGYGIDVTNPTKLVDMKAAGVIDPVRVTREALMNAVSIAGTTMTMGALVVENPKKEDSSPLAPGMGMY